MTYVMQLRKALIDELEASNKYDELIANAPDGDIAELEHIRNEEIEHTGELLKLLLKYDPSQQEHFNKGLE